MRKKEEMFYLMTHLTHFIYGRMAFWLRTTEITREETRFLHCEGVFYKHNPTDGTAYNTAFVTPVVEYWLE